MENTHSCWQDVQFALRVAKSRDEVVMLSGGGCPSSQMKEHHRLKQPPGPLVVHIQESPTDTLERQSS